MQYDNWQQAEALREAAYWMGYKQGAAGKRYNAPNRWYGNFRQKAYKKGYKAGLKARQEAQEATRHDA